MTCELSRLMIAFGTVAVTVGFTLLGMGMAYANPDDGLIRFSIGMMIVGAIVAIVGAVIYRVVDERPAERVPARQERRDTER